MAKVKSGPMLGVSGTIDGRTYCSLDGETIVKKKKRNNEKSMIALKRQGNKMKTLSAIYLSVKNSILDSIFRIEAKRLNLKSGYNVFVKENSKAIQDENKVGDYSFLNLSVGNLDIPFQLNRLEKVSGTLDLEWNVDCLVERESDELMVAVIYDNKPFTIILPEIPSIKRKDGIASINLYNLDATKAYVYCFFTNWKRDWFSRSIFFQMNF